jgi:hypothetical protein
MHKLFKQSTRFLAAILAIGLAQATLAEHHEEAEAGGDIRGMVMVIDAEVTAIDVENSHVTIQGPMGQTQTLTVTGEVVDIADIAIGDTIRATYLSALEGELREPTEEERENPWVVLEDEAKSTDKANPAIGAARMIRAVCTIEGMNRILGTVTVMDPRGKLHLIDDVEPEKMEGVLLGATIVLVYSEALALSLEKLEQ